MACKMSKLNEWFKKNKLLINWNKTKRIIFGNRKNYNSITTTIDDNLVERVN